MDGRVGGWCGLAGSAGSRMVGSGAVGDGDGSAERCSALGADHPDRVGNQAGDLIEGAGGDLVAGNHP